MSPVSSYFKQNYGTGLNRDVLKILENPAPLNQSAWITDVVDDSSLDQWKVADK